MLSALNWLERLMIAKRRPRVRVIAGEFKGRLLEYPSRGGFRPTMQRTKSSVFESLGAWLHGSVFVDLYAAAGGMGIEALSRGADLVCFVEDHHDALECLHRNLELCGIAPRRCRVYADDVTAFLESGRLGDINPDIVYVDPPYGETDFGVLLELLGKIVYPPPVLILIEHPVDVELNAPSHLTRTKVRLFGQTTVTFFVAGE